MFDLDFNFTAKLWVYQGSAAWHFLTLPEEVAREIKLVCGQRAGFGSVRVKAVIDGTEWKTSIFPDKRSNSFLLPMKAEVRKKCKILAGDEVTVTLLINP